MANGLVMAPGASLVPSITGGIQAGQQTILQQQAIEAERQRVQQQAQQQQLLQQQQEQARQLAAAGAKGQPVQTMPQLAQLFVDNPDLANQVLAGAGIRSEFQKNDLADFGFQLDQAAGDPDLQQQLIQQRIQTVRARGGDPKDSAALLGAPLERIAQFAKTVQLAALSPKERQTIAAQSVPSQQVQSSQILGDGTTIQVLRGGQTRVTDPEGNELSGQARSEAIQRARQQEAEQQAARAGGRAQAVSDVKVAETLTLEKVSEEVKQQLQLDKLKIDETKAKTQQEKEQLISTKRARRSEALNAASLVGNLLAGDRFSAAFGRLVANTPESFRTQEAIDAGAELDQITGLLSLESREKLKGQGTITDSEARTLEKSATVLSNRLISDDVARRELKRVRDIFEDAASRNQLSKQTLLEQQSQTDQPEPEQPPQRFVFDPATNQLVPKL